MLNAKQTRLKGQEPLHQQPHKGEKCQCNLKPLRMFVSGVGGTGKSWPSEDLACAIAASTVATGLAAFNVSGTTIHRLFQLPVEHKGLSAKLVAIKTLLLQKLCSSTATGPPELLPA